jgi:hypothetical protein
MSHSLIKTLAEAMRSAEPLETFSAFQKGVAAGTHIAGRRACACQLQKGPA